MPTNVLERPVEEERTAASSTLLPVELGLSLSQSLRPPQRSRRMIPFRHLPLLGVIALVGTVTGWNISAYPTLSDDEGTYAAQAWAVQQGMGLAHYTYWYDHPPLAWMQMALFTWIPEFLSWDGLAVAQARLLMLGVTILSTVLVYLLARRIKLTRWAAVLAALLFGLSPLAVTLHRQVYLDNIAVAWMLGAFVLALSPRRAMWAHAGAGVAAAVAILSKETMVLALPGLLIALWQGTDGTNRKFSLAGFGCGLVLIGSLYPLYALLKGEFFPGDDHVSLIGALLFQVADREGSGSILATGSGANELLDAWLFYDPILLVGGVIAVLATWPSRRLRPVAVAGLAFVLMALRPGGYLPAMYVIQVLPFFAIALAGVAQTGFYELKKFTLITPRRYERAVALTIAAAMVLTIVLPPWLAGTHRALTASENTNYEEAVQWISTNVDNPVATRVAVDNVIWLELVNQGFTPGTGVIWFYKLDLDPAVRLPNGWRDLDYIVASPIVRQDAANLPILAKAIANSDVVAQFGAGDGQLEIRQVRG